VVVRGRGFDIFALTAAVLGDPTKADAYFTDVTPVSPTELDVTIPARPGDLTVDEVTAALQIETMASPNAGDLTSSDPDHQPSNAVTVTYAGLPKVRAISARLGPVTGGTGITLSGKGLRPTGMAVFASIPTSSMEVGFMSTAQTMIATSTSAATFLAPPSLPGPTSVMACTVTGCSDPKDSVSFAYYPLGEASITGLSRTHSTAKGGDLLEITGENLACALEVRFRGVAKVTPRLVPSLTGCGGSTSLKVRVPAAWKGASAQVQVLTAEGVGEGSGYSPSEQGFTYTWGR